MYVGRFVSTTRWQARQTRYIDGAHDRGSSLGIAEVFTHYREEGASRGFGRSFSV